MTETLIRPLSPAEQLCLSCPLPPPCNDKHPRCAWRRAEKGHQRTIADDITDHIQEHGAATYSQLLHGLNLKRGSLAHTLRRMWDHGQLDRQRTKATGRPFYCYMLKETKP